MVNSGFITGLSVKDAQAKMIAWLEENGVGKAKTQYKLRAWLFSRQRYWGEPFPVIHWEDGTQSLVPEEDLAKIERFHTLPQVIEEEITEPVTWYLGFAVPIEFFQRYSGINPELSGQAWRANFTKCADKCSHPCWLTWQKLVPPGGYHVPDQFGTIIFE